MNFYQIIKYRYLVYTLINFLRIKTKPLNPPPFFILGSGRNGSTLLSSILNAHTNIFIPPEQFVLPYAIMIRHLFFFKSKDSWKNNIISLFNSSNKTLNWEINLSEIKIEKKEVAELFNKIYLKYAEKKNDKVCIWGDKTPINIHYIEFIYPEFQNAKYIFLLRDVRDVVLSYKKLKKHKAVDTKYAIWKWIDSIVQLKYLQKRTNVLLIKYEDLVENPSFETNKVLSFLKVNGESNLVFNKNVASDMGVGEKPHHQNLNKPISSRFVGKWKTELSKKDILLIEKKCSKYLIEFGYQV